MKIKFLGAAGTVTGSSYALTSGSGQSILIDLGMFQGIKAIDQLNYEPFDYDCSRLAGAVLTHAHLDHCGRLPILLPRGFGGDIWMTSPTYDLTELSLFDSAKIAKFDKKKALYDKKLVEKTIDQFKTTSYGTTFHIGGFAITMRDAGHIVGSASLEIEDLIPSTGLKKIIFSGDIGNYPEDLVKETEMINGADAVVIESTYGDKLHPDLVAVEALQAEINAVETSGGALLIPAFSLEKTQDLLHMIMHLKQDGKVKSETPVFLDSPMAQKATQIYLRYPEIFNAHILEEMRNGNPFEFPGFQVTTSNEDSNEIHDRPGPKIIIAGSGMMTGGRILSHAAHYLPTPTTRLFIVGYQGEETIGRQLLDGNKTIVIDKANIQVKATINNTRAMSSHADQAQLLAWLKHINGVKKVFITHGEDPARAALKEKISQDLGISDIVLPKLNQEIAF
jgi:metallo-beta-lactamase family protein